MDSVYGMGLIAHQFGKQAPAKRHHGKKQTQPQTDLPEDECWTVQAKATSHT
ncbi:hypothetical protein BG015_005974, partial [Linnemannia schmuckeri]